MDGQELRRVFALANAFKEGDLAVGGTADDAARHAARAALLGTTIGDIHRTVLVDDGLTAALERSRDRSLDAQISALTIAHVRSALLGSQGLEWAGRHAPSLASETIAAIVKVMSDEELAAVAMRLVPPVAQNEIVLGTGRHFGSRIQPNSAGDDEQEILFSVLEGLSYGCGDVVIGVNPAADDLDSIVRLEQLLEQIVRRLGLPTRYCVLSDIVKQHAAQRHVRVDVGFQSLAGTSRALAGMVGLDVDGVLDLARSFDGLYFETGQGSEITNGTAEGVDMVTLEARTYGVARAIKQHSGMPWMIVNDVAGFIGPEVFRTSEQLERACLEDIVMARLHGLTMGLDVCATFHMGIAPRELRALTARIVARAAPSYLMAVAGNADPMLGYLTTSFREHPRLRSQTSRDMTSVMRRRLDALGALMEGQDVNARSQTIARLYSTYMKAGGDRRSSASLEEEGQRRLHELHERGLDLGITDSNESDARLDRVYANARAALYARFEEAVLSRSTSQPVRVRTAAKSRDEYLAHPDAGERVRLDDARSLGALYLARPPRVQIVVSDGLNANAVNEQLPALLPQLRRMLSERGIHVGDRDLVVENGRVRAGYEIGGLVGAELVIHLIGERPGTGLNTLSAYVTYGRDVAGQWRWTRSLDHSATTAVCGIHPRGKPPDAAAFEVAGVVMKSLERRKSGVALSKAE